MSTNDAAAGDMLAAALKCAARGWPVFPVSADKKPRTDNGFKDATTDPDLIAAWWRRWPDAGIAVATGATSGIVVLDVDPRHGGVASMQKLKLPQTAQVLTGSGGIHLYFKYPEGGVRCSAGKLGDGLDVRGDGGYIIVPPTVHATGNPYKKLNGHKMAEWPAELNELNSHRNGGSASAVGDVIPEGQRDQTLASLAGTMRRRGMSEAEIRAALIEANRQRCKPPLLQADVERIAASIASYQPAPDKRQPRAPQIIMWQRGTAVELKPIVFLDKPLLLAAAFHLLCGRKGQGKGTLLALIAAMVMRGLLGPKRNVVWIGSEDSAGVDIIPRIIAAGGDPDRLLLVKEGWIQLPRDLDAIGEAIRDFGDVGMVVIDPVANHIAGTDANTEQVREAIAPLNKLADEHDAMVFGVRHISEKDASKGVLAAIMGNSAWVQTPRAVLAVARDMDDLQLSHVQCVAGNRLPPGTPGRIFRIEAVPFRDFPEPVTKAVWLGESTQDVEQLLAGKTKEQSRSAVARELILDTLENQPDTEMESDTLDALVARESGLSAKTVKNIRSQLADSGLVKSRPEKDDKGHVARWFVRRTQAPRTPVPGPSRQASATQIPTASGTAAGNGSAKPKPDQTPLHTVSGSGLIREPDPGFPYTGPGAGAAAVAAPAGRQIEQLPPVRCTTHQRTTKVTRVSSGLIYLACGCHLLADRTNDDTSEEVSS